MGLGNNEAIVFGMDLDNAWGGPCAEYNRKVALTHINICLPKCGEYHVDIAGGGAGFIVYEYITTDKTVEECEGSCLYDIVATLATDESLLPQQIQIVKKEKGGSSSIVWSGVVDESFFSTLPDPVVIKEQSSCE